MLPGFCASMARLRSAGERRRVPSISRMTSGPPLPMRVLARDVPTIVSSWLEPIARIIPTRFAFEGLRRAIFLGEGWARDAVILLAMGLVTLPLATYFFARAVDHTRRAGTLTQY